MKTCKRKCDIQPLAKGKGGWHYAVFVEHNSDTNHLEELKEKGVPLVLFDRVAENIDVTKVTTDYNVGGIRAIDHLIEKGCKRIAFLAISKTLSVSTDE